jgi:hypothetical protein
MLVRADTGPATPVGRYSYQGLAEPTEPPAWLRASRVAPIDPRWLSSHLIQRIGNVARFSNLAIVIRLSAFLGRFQEPAQFRDPVCERLSVLGRFQEPAQFW